MNWSTPRWWYVRSGAPAPVVRALLRPLAWIWASVTARRLRQTVPVDVGPPVICVGNLTMGGTGKTPVVRALAELLRGEGHNVHILSRGYGGRQTEPLQVDPRFHDAEAVGDEPLMLAKDWPVWVARDRVAGARAAAAAGASLVLMDDGHQNPSLHKMLSLIVVDGETRDGEWPFGDGAVFPAGPLREPLAEGLARADAVILLLPADLVVADPELLALFAPLPVILARLTPRSVPPPGPQVGFAGIAKPWKVQRALKAAGCDLVDFADFPDHGRFSERLLEALADRAQVYSAGLVTTEKDWVRLPSAWRSRVVPWPVTVTFDNDDQVRTLLAFHGLDLSHQDPGPIDPDRPRL